MEHGHHGNHGVNVTRPAEEDTEPEQEHATTQNPSAVVHLVQATTMKSKNATHRHADKVCCN